MGGATDMYSVEAADIGVVAEGGKSEEEVVFIDGVNGVVVAAPE